jgi:hypothetical protein
MQVHGIREGMPLTVWLALWGSKQGVLIKFLPAAAAAAMTRQGGFDQTLPPLVDMLK